MKKHDKVKGVLNENSITGDSLKTIVIDGAAKPTSVIYTSGASNFIVDDTTTVPTAIVVYTGGTIAAVSGTTTTCILDKNFITVFVTSPSYVITQVNGSIYLNGVLMISDKTYAIGADTVTYLGKTTLGFTVNVVNN